MAWSRVPRVVLRALCLGACAAAAPALSAAQDDRALADTYIQQGEYRSAEELLTRLLSAGGPPELVAEWHFLRGVARQEGGTLEGDSTRWPQALADYRAAVAANPALAPPALNNSAKIAEQRGDWRLAASLYDRAAAGPHPLRALFLYNRGGALEQLGLPDSALAAYGNALSADTAYTPARAALLRLTPQHRPVALPPLARESARHGLGLTALDALLSLLAGDGAAVDAPVAEAALVAVADVLATLDPEPAAFLEDRAGALRAAARARPGTAPGVSALLQAYEAYGRAPVPADAAGWWFQDVRRLEPFSRVLAGLGSRAVVAGRQVEARRYFQLAIGPARFDTLYANYDAWIPLLALAAGDGPRLAELRERLDAVPGGAPGRPAAAELRRLHGALAGIANLQGDARLAFHHARQMHEATLRLRASGIEVENPRALNRILVAGYERTDPQRARQLAAEFSQAYAAAGLFPEAREFRLLGTFSDLAVRLDTMVVSTPGRDAASGGAVVVLEPADAARGTLADVLRTRVAGLTVVQGSGSGPQRPTILVRGAGYSDEPLYVVDGVLLAQSSPSPLGEVDPAQVESLEVLKGPAAAGLYGARAANGVVLITTRSGRQATARTAVNVTVEQGLSSFGDAARRIDRNWGVQPGTGEPFALNLVQQERALGRRIFGTGHQQEYTASVSGGGVAATYHVSANARRGQGIERPDRFTTAGARANVNLIPARGWTADANVSVQGENARLACDAECPGVLFSTVFADPDSVASARRGFLEAPPEELWEMRTASRSGRRVIAGASVRHALSPALDGAIDLGADLYDRRQRVPVLTSLFADSTSALLRLRTHERVRGTATQLRGALTLRIPVAADGESRTHVGLALAGSGTRVRLSAAPDQDGAPGPAPWTAARSRSGRILDAFALQELTFGDLTATGSVRLAHESERSVWRAYPHISASWNAGYGTIERLPHLDELRLRVAYGEAGSWFDPLTVFRLSLPLFAESGMIPPESGDSRAIPSRVAEVEASAEARMLDGAVEVEATYYRRRVRNEPVLRPVASGAGTLPEVTTLRSLFQEGVELRADLSLPAHRGVDAGLALAVRHQRSRVAALGPEDAARGFLAIGRQRYVAGFPAGAWFERRVVSAELDATGTARNVLCDGGRPGGRTLPDGTPLEPGGPPVPCEDAPAVYLGRSDPAWTGTLAPSLELPRGISVRADLDWAVGYRRFDANLQLRCQVFRVCEENFFPLRFGAERIAQVQSGARLTAFAITRADYLRLGAVSVGLGLPGRWVRWAGGRSAHATLTARNLGLWTSWTGLDPQAEALRSFPRPVEFAVTPPLSQLVLRMNVSF